MKLVVYLILAVCIMLNASLVQPHEKEWDRFLTNFKPIYKDSFELEYCKQIFLVNLQSIEKHNHEYEEGLQTYRKGVNRFTDRTTFENQQILSGFNIDALREFKDQGLPNFNHENDANIPESIDWRESGAVTQVKDQRACYSCWAFSVTGALEGAYFLATNKSASFSEQQLVDCSKKNYGCGGGFPSNGFADLRKMGGIATENSYPYKAKKHKCMFNKNMTIAKVTGYKTVHASEKALKQAVALYGPTSVGIEATGHFQGYKKGIFFDKTCSGKWNKVNHAVLVVGYGSDNGTDYWIVKNSWSKYWGEKGYARMRRNEKNHCNIASFASYPIVIAQ